MTYQSPISREQRVDLIRLPTAALLPAWPLDLHDVDPGGEQELAQPGAVGAGPLDPDHDVLTDVCEPVSQLQVTGRVGLDRHSAHQLAEPVERPREVLMLMCVHATAIIRFLLIVDSR